MGYRCLSEFEGRGESRWLIYDEQSWPRVHHFTKDIPSKHGIQVDESY
jgi:hypothetical protein